MASVHSISDMIAAADDWAQKIDRAMRFGRKQQATFLQILAGPLKVGRPMLAIAEHIHLHGTKVQREVAAELIDTLERGRGVCEALEGWIEPVSLAALKAAEKGGTDTFTIALEAIGNELEESSQASSQILLKALYPAAFVLISLIMVIFLLGPIIEDLRSLIGNKPDETLDRASAVRDFYINWLWIVAIGILGLVATYRFAMRNYVGSYRKAIDGFQVGGVYPFAGYRLAVGARAVAIYALLKQFGMPVGQIIRILAETGTTYLKHHCESMTINLTRGKTNEIEILNTGLLDQSHISLLRLYTEAREESLVAAYRSAAKAINAQVQLRSRITALLVVLLLGSWFIFNLLIIISVVIGFDPKSHF